MLLNSIHFVLTKTSAALGGNFLFTAFTVAEAANLLIEEAIFTWHRSYETSTNLQINLPILKIHIHFKTHSKLNHKF